MHRGLISCTESRGYNLENNPQAYGGHTCLWALYILAIGRNSRERRLSGCMLSAAAPGGTTPTQGFHCFFSITRAIQEEQFTSPSTQKPHMDTNTQTNSRLRNGDHALDSRHRSVSRSPTRRKQRKRGGKGRSGPGGQGKRRQADRLSKRYFRICSWNCASACRRSVVLEKTVYDFDVVCLQKTRTRPNRPLVLQDFIVIQRHRGRGNSSSERP